MTARSGIRIRHAGPADAALVTELIEELNAHQREPTGHVTSEAVRRDGFGPSPEFKVLLAEHDGTVGGYALYHPSWSTEFGERGLYLYDLYVREAARGHGLGRALMAALAAEAKAQGRTFLWWCSKEWNHEAQRFYAQLGAIEETIKAHALFGQAFDDLAASDRSGPTAEDA